MPPVPLKQLRQQQVATRLHPQLQCHQQVATRSHPQLQCHLPALLLPHAIGAAICALFAIARAGAAQLGYIGNTFVTTTAGTECESPSFSCWFKWGCYAEHFQALDLAMCLAAADEPFNPTFDLLECDAETGWESECADPSGIRWIQSFWIYNFDLSGSHDLTGFSGDASAFGSELAGGDATGNRDFSLAGGLDLPAESFEYEASEISLKHASNFYKRLNDEHMVTNIDSFGEAAYSMIPVETPKPIWVQGVWADTFGNAVFWMSGWTSMELKKLPLPCATASWDTMTSPNPKEAKSVKVSAYIFAYYDMPINKTDPTRWDERESLLQSRLNQRVV